MEPPDARSMLRARDARTRLLAARRLIHEVNGADLPLLRELVRHERDLYVRTALMLAIRKATAGTPTASDATEASLRGASVRELTSRLTHEIDSVASTLRFHAENEIDPFEGSSTARELDRLDVVLQAIRQLGDAAEEPHFDETDIAQFARALAGDEGRASGVPIMFDGDEPSLVIVDRGLASLVLRNGIANAIEATQEAGEPYSAVVIAWGTDDLHHWITVLDRGVGLAESSEQLSRIGVSTKQDHTGLGLAVATEAAESLGGALTLESRTDGGAYFRCEWPRRVA
jgi:signal transduction histidine kinase